ncbi:intermembrane phospholipid transport protein YdbH family protein [Phenylobacterium sp.]|uniref:intermembrane phospholipid transport protein YdbH family protein n=1 Tax=Phenylobacterium sp. TaxID=1871053 RepID=UPI002ED9F07C
MTDAPKKRPRRTLLRLLAVAGVIVLVAAALTWLNRRSLARDALTGWLEGKGIPARAEVEAFGPSTFTAKLSIGDPSNPDFTAERAEVRYRTRLTGLEVVSVTLRKPVLRAQLRADGLHVGALDPLVQEFLRRPPRPDAAKPRISIDDGVLVLSTDYGPVRVAADALVEDGQLQTLTATSAPMRLRGKDFDIALGAGTLREVTRAGRADVTLVAPVTAATAGPAKLTDARLTLAAQIPYPDFQKRRGEGVVVANVTLAGKRAEMAGQALGEAELKAAFTGQAKGWIPDLSVRGRLAGDVRAGTGRFGAASARAIRVAVTSEDLAWTRKGGDRVAGVVKLNGGVDGLDAGELRLADFAVTAAGPLAASAAGVEADLTGSAVGRGAWSGLGAPTTADAGDMAAIKRAARGFRVAAPKVAVRMKGGGLTVGLPQPLRLAPDSGGAVTLAARGGQPVFGPQGGAFRLTVAGGGLPGLDADVSRFTVTDGGASAAGRFRLRTSMAALRGGEIDASGRLNMAGGATTFTADRCVAVKAERLEFGANDIEAVAGRLCPVGGPLFAMRGETWRVSGRAEGATGAAPFLQGRVADGAGRVRASGVGAKMTADIHVDTARQEDTAPETRFNPFLMSGDVTLREFIWRADLAFRRPDAGALGTALVTHDGRLGFGAAVFETVMLEFAEGGLQPVQISPLASAVGSPAVGSAKFSGRFDWALEGSSSSGKLVVPGLDFQSPAGPVKGLKGEIAFESLAPLKAAPGQELTVAELQSAVLLTGLRARFELIDNLVKIEGGEAAVGGGRIRAETLEIPLTPGAATRGVVYVEGVQLHDLVEATPFGDKVELDAKVSGKLPFEITGDKIRISGGQLAADQPGRISIDRAALTGVTADSATPVPAEANPNDTFTDFAYQAMENLAFDKLEVSVTSRDDGRLASVFHIVGRHDPPEKQRIRLTIMDLIQRRFLGQKLPLPSGTGVDLTLDTSLNLDDLIADWGEYQRTKNSAGVQP